VKRHGLQGGCSFAAAAVDVEGDEADRMTDWVSWPSTEGRGI
jgi:hypothetical protein